MAPSKLSMLTGYRSKGRSTPSISYPEMEENIPEAVSEEIKDELINETMVDKTIEQEMPEESLKEETTIVESEETETETKTEVDESEEEEEEEDEEELDIDENDLTDEEKNIYDALSEVYKKGGKKVVDELQKVKGFDKFMVAVEDQFMKYHAESKDYENKIIEKDDAIQNLKKDQVNERKEWELKKLEIQRYQLDENDEYMLDLKRRFSKEPSDTTLQNKLRDEYLRGIAEVDPEFDMFEYRNRIVKRKASGIENLSGSNKSTAALILEDKPVSTPGFARRSRT